jgi:hypothetical protein
MSRTGVPGSPEEISFSSTSRSSGWTGSVRLSRDMDPTGFMSPLCGQNNYMQILGFISSSPLAGLSWQTPQVTRKGPSLPLLRSPPSAPASREASPCAARHAALSTRGGVRRVSGRSGEVLRPSGIGPRPSDWYVDLQGRTKPFPCTLKAFPGRGRLDTEGRYDVLCTQTQQDRLEHRIAFAATHGLSERHLQILGLDSRRQWCRARRGTRKEARRHRPQVSGQILT